MQKFTPFFILVFLVGLIAISSYNLKHSKDQNQNIEESDESNDFTAKFEPIRINLPEFSLPDLYDENSDFSKKDLLGHYSVVNFFASWCTTCRAEHDVLLQLKAQNFVKLYGVAWRDIPDSTKSFLEKSENPFDKIAVDSRGLFSRITAIEAVPETLIIDPEGNVIARYRGNLQDFSIDEIKKRIGIRN